MALDFKEPNGNQTGRAGDSAVAFLWRLYPVGVLCLASLSSAACGDSLSDPGGESDPDPVEITLQYIQRLPAMDYVWDADDPTTEGWPEVGETVTWRMHLRNWSGESQTVSYLWRLDGSVAAQGEVTLPPSGTGTVDRTQTWTFDRHRLEFELDPANEILEESEGNNSLLVHTDALSIGFYVEQSLYDFFRENQHKLNGVPSTSWEDWAHRHIRRMNRIFEEAVYPDTPHGVLDRVRLNEIHVVPDGSLPSTNHPNDQDRSVDLVYGFTANQTSWCSDLSTPDETNYCYLNPTLVHELGHARYLVDTYAQSVSHDPQAGMIIDISEGGEPVVGSPYMPVLAVSNGTREIVHWAEQEGLMNDDYSVVDPYSAAALNLIAGHRATRGNFNDPENLGEFMNDLPEENRIALTDQSSLPLAGASVEVYRSPVFSDPEGQRLWKQFDDTPDLTAEADDQGAVLVGRNPFGGTDSIDRWNWSNTVIILRVEHDGRIGYAFLESLPFNMEYWRGHTALGEYDLQVNMITQD